MHQPVALRAVVGELLLVAAAAAAAAAAVAAAVLRVVGNMVLGSNPVSRGEYLNMKINVCTLHNNAYSILITSCIINKGPHYMQCHIRASCYTCTNTKSWYNEAGSTFVTLQLSGHLGG